uniref:NID domain-containing protein n=1 Tax=Oryzias latipes TaxID=8090 RepID=A0A3P9ITX0_ORYLA
MLACMKQQESLKEEFTQNMKEVQTELQKLSRRKQDLLEELRRCQEELKAKREESCSLKQTFTICAHIPEAEVRFVAPEEESSEESPCGDQLIRGVFTIIQRSGFPLKGGQALLTFEEEKVAAQILRIPRCQVSCDDKSVHVKPRRVTLDSSVKFQVNLNVSRTHLKVFGVPSALPGERTKDRLEVSFSRPSRGGGEVKSVEYDQTTGEGLVTFLHPGEPLDAADERTARGGMACVLCSRTRLVTYLPGIHALVRRVAGTRTFAAVGPTGSVDPDRSRTSFLSGVWEVTSDKPWGPKDPLGLQDPLEQRLQLLTCSEEQRSSSHKSLNPAVMLPRSSDEDHRGLCDGGHAAPPHRVPSADCFLGGLGVECAVQSCPSALKKDFRSMFPEERLSDLTVVTVTQRTRNDMTSWSAQVEQERLEKLDQFVLGATEICSALQKKGFWADFIDPSSGLPFFGAHTNNVLFETDDRYQQLGFSIEDLGCCKAIRHPAWGTHVFVGALFTDAPCGTLTDTLDCD